MKEKKLEDIINRLEIVFSNELFNRKFSTSNKNWLNKSNEEVLSGIILFLNSLDK